MLQRIFCSTTRTSFIYQRSLATAALRKGQLKVTSSYTTPPQVYQKISEQLLANPQVPDAATEDHRKAIENAREILLESMRNKEKNTSKVQSPETLQDVENDAESQDDLSPESEKSGFMKRLVKDGGDKVGFDGAIAFLLLVSNADECTQSFSDTQSAQNIYTY